MKRINFFYILALSWKLPTVCGWLDSSYSNASSTPYSSSTSSISVTTATITEAPIHCGTCALYYEVHAHIWWSIIYTAYTASIFYTVDSGTGSTIGSSIRYTPNDNAISDGTNITAYANWGGVEYTTLNTLGDADLETIVQVNSITMAGAKNGYGVSTQHINSSMTGTAMTQCIYSYFSPNTNKPHILPGLPATTAYDYTTVLPFRDKSWNTTSAFFYGLNSLASEVATFLHLTVPNCTSYGGGSGTVKIGVTALTSISISYTSAAQEVSQTQETNPPPSSTEKTQPAPAPSPSPPAPPAPTTPTSAAPPGSTTIVPQRSSASSAQALPPPIVTQILSISTSVLPASPSQPVSSSGGSYTTTIVETTSGPSGLETLSEVTTLALGSYILSVIGITGGSKPTTTSTLAPGLASGSATTSSGPAAFTGNACRMSTSMWQWTLIFVLAWLAFGGL